jgi:membrane glycosyltransferase
LAALGEPGAHNGYHGYVSALFWLLFLVFALALTFQSIYTVPNYFSDSFPLFPVWLMQTASDPSCCC